MGIAEWKMRRDFDLEALDEAGRGGAATVESPGLEEYRRWRARGEKNRVLEHEESLVSREFIQQQWAVRTIAMAQAVKACGKKIAPEDPQLRAEIDEYMFAQLRNWSREMPAVDEAMVQQLFGLLGIAELRGEDGNESRNENDNDGAGEARPRRARNDTIRGKTTR